MKDEGCDLEGPVKARREMRAVDWRPRKRCENNSEIKQSPRIRCSVMVPVISKVVSVHGLL